MTRKTIAGLEADLARQRARADRLARAYILCHNYISDLHRDYCRLSDRFQSVLDEYDIEGEQDDEPESDSVDFGRMMAAIQALERDDVPTALRDEVWATMNVPMPRPDEATAEVPL